MLVGVAAAAEEIPERIVAPRAFDLAPDRRELEAGEMTARGEPDQVGRAADQLAVETPHAPSIGHG